MTQEWDEDTWYNNFLSQKCCYENAREAYNNFTAHNQEMYDNMIYHYFQMIDCAEQLKKFGTVVELPE